MNATNQVISSNNVSFQTYRNEYMTVLMDKFKNMSWADICFTIEEEDERNKKEENARKLQEILAERRRLYTLGQYELEEGEILE